MRMAVQTAFGRLISASPSPAHRPCPPLFPIHPHPAPASKVDPAQRGEDGRRCSIPHDTSLIKFGKSLLGIFLTIADADVGRRLPRQRTEELPAIAREGTSCITLPTICPPATPHSRSRQENHQMRRRAVDGRRQRGTSGLATPTALRGRLCTATATPSTTLSRADGASVGAGQRLRPQQR